VVASYVGSTEREPFEQLAEVDHGDPNGRVAAAAGQHDVVAVNHGPAGVDDVRDVTFAFRRVGGLRRSLRRYAGPVILATCFQYQGSMDALVVVR
jgi:hypothetical protein